MGSMRMTPGRHQPMSAIGLICATISLACCANGPKTSGYDVKMRNYYNQYSKK